MAVQMTQRIARQITRRDFAALAGGFLLSANAAAQTETALLTRPIPGSGERIPAVGLGTAYVFDENNGATRSKADAVVQALINNGGRLVDTASTYGDAESDRLPGRDFAAQGQAGAEKDRDGAADAGAGRRRARRGSRDFVGHGVISELRRAEPRKRPGSGGYPAPYGARLAVD